MWGDAPRGGRLPSSSRRAPIPGDPVLRGRPSMLTPGVRSAVETSDAAVVVPSGAAALRVNENPLELLDAAGNVVAQETAPIAWTDQTAAVGVPTSQTSSRWRRGPTSSCSGSRSRRVEQSRLRRLVATSSFDRSVAVTGDNLYGIVARRLATSEVSNDAATAFLNTSKVAPWPMIRSGNSSLHHDRLHGDRSGTSLSRAVCTVQIKIWVPRAHPAIDHPIHRVLTL
jgi:hypothetical protein